MSRLALAAALMAAGPAVASESFTDWRPFGLDTPKWDGQYLRMSTGFDVVSYGKGRTYGGPVLGVEAGKMWRDGNVVYGFSGAMSYMKAFGSGLANTSGHTMVTRDFGGEARFKLGYLATPDLLLYSTVGVAALNETWRYPQIAGGGEDTRFRVRPQVGAGFEWAINSTTRLYGEIIVSPPVR